MLAVAGLAALYWGLSETGTLEILSSEDRLKSMVERLGLWGPVAIIALMVAAIVMSPIPSGPIAMVAGAAFGPLWGTLYVVIGAELGAITAFWIARCLGYKAVRRWIEGRWAFLTRPRSQTALMGLVFASRLIPFVSFDAVSYAAGLTPLSFWRFALATLAGVVPISFALAYFGEALTSVDPKWALLIAVGIGGITLVPIGVKLLRRWLRKKPAGTLQSD